MDAERSDLAVPSPSPRSEQLILPEVDLQVPGTGFVPERVRRVFCNRSIRLDQIEWIGFDMDYTLALYDQQRMDQLTIDAAMQKLVLRGYPASLAEVAYDTNFPVRGLIIDAKLGNVLKMDRYKYVKRAYHGARELSYEERRELYHANKVRTKKSSRFHYIDSMYALSEVTMFAAGVTHLESLGMELDYHKFFYDIREAVDLSHQDGSILDRIMAKPEDIIVRDPDLPLTLHKLRSAGKKLFLLTNSQPGYTDHMMTHLLGGQLPEYKNWKHYFDIVITAAKKPRFFIEEELPILDVHQKPVRKLERGKLYTGGCIASLSALGKVNGDRVLYVGDHIYGDVLRAKKHSAWRTAMIVQELEQELVGVQNTLDAHDRWDRLEEARQALFDELRSAQGTFKDDEKKGLAPSAERDAQRLRLRRRIERTKARIRAVEDECAELERQIEQSFHRYWGPIMKAGAEPSSFGHQVETYACLYTGRVSNLLGYSPMHYFRGPRERLPHEL